MARFIDEPLERDIVSDYIDGYVSSTRRYSKYQETAPNFVTYYKLDHSESTSDYGLDNVEEIVGNNSPLKYNKIKNMPLYSVETMSPNFDYDEESGPSMEGTDSEAIILPETIEPSVNDFIVFDYMDKGKYSKIFRVNNVEISMMDDKPYYKVSFGNYPISLEVLEERQVNKTYTVLYQNIGTGSSPLILEDEYVNIRNNIVDLEEVVEIFIDNHYDSKINSLYIDSEIDGNRYIDFSMNYFINDTGILNNRSTYLKNFILSVPNDYSKRQFIDSPFYSIQYKEKTLPVTIVTKLYRKDIFSLYREKYFNIDYSKVDIDENPHIQGNLGEMYTFPNFRRMNKLIKSYQNEYSLNETNIVDKVIVSYIMGKVSQKDIEEVLEYYKHKIGMLDTQEFVSFIMILYIVRKGIDSKLNRHKKRSKIN